MKKSMLFLMIAVLFFNCFEGPAGPAGEKGEQGIRGDSGIIEAWSFSGELNRYVNYTDSLSCWELFIVYPEGYSASMSFKQPGTRWINEGTINDWLEVFNYGPSYIVVLWDIMYVRIFDFDILLDNYEYKISIIKDGDIVLRR